MIHGSCADYRAAATIDLKHDADDIDRKVGCPALVFYGANGVIAQLYDIPAEWRKSCATITTATLPGGHFFVDQYPGETARILREFLQGVRA
jgi:haloacetate dehalogenase